ncbi:hypothetical protein MKY59_04620 [Paenibacillus sp. FSL W8-0426]|uniref:hypothetical protein n=1 Tax=Paenibacillus sp. FSL W8-0426 TaxID=2921714 RepID=UPI0030D75C85
MPPGLKDIELDEWITDESRKEVFISILDDVENEGEETLKPVAVIVMFRFNDNYDRQICFRIANEPYSYKPNYFTDLFRIKIKQFFDNLVNNKDFFIQFLV